VPVFSEGESDVVDMNSEADPRSAKAYRRARLAVIILTTLLVLGMVALVAGFVRQARLMMASHAAVRTVVSEGAAATVMLAPGARIVSATTEAGKLVLQVATPSGGEVEIIDLASGKLTGQVKTQAPK
jgi:hypothetical protein